jgi:hypothetical protein
MKNREWTDEDDRRLIELRAGGQSTPQIAKALTSELKSRSLAEFPS